MGFKPKTAVRRLCDSKHKPLAIKSGNELWSHVKTLRGRTLIIDAVKKALHKLIVNHPSVIKPPIARDCLQIKIYGQTKKQTMPRLLFQTSILELNNSMVISYTNVGLKDSPKNRYARKSLKTNSNTLGFKPKTAVRRLCDSKHKPLAIKSGNELWSHVKTLRGRTLIIDAVKKALHKLIVNHPSVIKPPIARDCLQIKIYGQTKKQTMPRLLFQTSILELNNSMVISYTNVGLKDSIDKENNIIISDSILRNILPPQLKNMTSRYKIMFGCKYCMSDKSMHLLFLS